MFGGSGGTRTSRLALGLSVALCALPIGADVAHAASASETGAPGGATMTSATQLYDELGYRGTIRRGEAQWYKLSSQGAERALVDLWGRTRSCPVRATLMNAHRRMLGEMISSAKEILPFAAPLPARPYSGVYYLRIDADPYSTCASAGYVLKLIEPETPAPMESPVQEATPPQEATKQEAEPTTTPAHTAPSYGPAPGIQTNGCSTALYALSRATVVVERDRYLVRRHRARVASLRSAEAHKLTARRRERAACEYG